MTDAQDPQEVIARLQADLRGEHAAIVQYLEHVFKMEEVPGLGEIPCEVEEIAREEMRHFKWLSETIVELGGVPNLDRDPIFIDGAPPPGLMRLDLEAEDRAIALYEKHVAEINDPRITTLIRRILSDEYAHRERFIDYIAETAGEPSVPSGVQEIGPVSEVPTSSSELQLQANVPHALPPAVQDTIAMLNEDIVGQYRTVLTYLLQAFLTPDCPVSKDLLVDRSQWEMKHWGWLAEKVAELGGEPSTNKPDVTVSGDTGAMLASDLQNEEQMLAVYRRHEAAIADPEVKKLLQRIAFNKTYEETKLKELLEVLNREGVAQSTGKDITPPSQQSEASQPGAGFTVGSLIAKFQDEG
jgi:bacterioferritin